MNIKLKIIIYLLLFILNISCEKKEESNKDVQFLCCTDHPKSNQNIDNLNSSEQIYVSPLVTGNDDGINDFLFIRNIHLYSDNILTIYDIEDNMIFKTIGYNNLNNVFSGRNNDLSLEYPTGTYQYRLIIENEDTFVENGYLCLVKTESKEKNKNNCSGFDINDPFF